MFKEIQWNYTYSTEDDDILADFYIPLISRSVTYDRAVGYFSAGILNYIGVGLERFIKSDGKMRLIIGEPLSEEEYIAVLSGEKIKVNQLEEQLTNLLLERKSNSLKTLCYLVASGKLEIKFALRKRGMFHQKIGIAKDIASNVIVFEGSANETPSAYSDDVNSEQVSLYPSWTSAYESHGKKYQTNFENLWNNSRVNTKVIPVTSSFYKKVKDKIALESLYKEIGEFERTTDNSPNLVFSYTFDKGVHEPPQKYTPTKSIKSIEPRIPEFIGANSFKLFPHQRKAIDSWFNNDCVGLFKLATGSGKTITSMCAMVELYEDRIKQGKSTFSVISVPYIELANQWIKELKNFNCHAIKCFESSSQWTKKLEREIQLFNLGDLNFCCVVVVNATFRGDLFQGLIRRVAPSELLVIGDECHHFGSEGMMKILPDSKYRLGLSATPFRSDEDEVDNPFPDIARKNLLEYFSSVVAVYTLQDAINDGVLASYRYDIVPVYLTELEQEEYDELSQSITRLVLKRKSAPLSSDEQMSLTTMCGLRSRILATCAHKIPALINYLKHMSQDNLKHALFYVGEGKAPGTDEPYLDSATRALFSLGIKVSKFTSSESSEQRKRIMDDFKECMIDGLVAMKVLDEGIDVPVCQHAFILASTRNPRQYVQRRGRVLRKAKGKTQAEIVDFVVLPNPDVVSSYAKQLKSAEMTRVRDFMNTASNITEIQKRIEYI
jgi:superfamily II DNA or RNA helicase